MRVITKNMIKNLSFPDFNVIRMEFSPETKLLKIYVDGGWLDIDGGIELEEGVLFFKDWEKLSIKIFNHESEKWTKLENSIFEPLNNISEAHFNDNEVRLCGFGKKLGLWTEWQIENAKIQAEFMDSNT